MTHIVVLERLSVSSISCFLLRWFLLPTVILAPVLPGSAAAAEEEDGTPESLRVEGVTSGTKPQRTFRIDGDLKLGKLKAKFVSVEKLVNRQYSMLKIRLLLGRILDLTLRCQVSILMTRAAHFSDKPPSHPPYPPLSFNKGAVPRWD